MLQGFLPLFLMTFCICLFIVMMQFLWRFIDDLVGKGLEISVIGELFFYAAMTMVPMALPLAILLASLMLFGNLGERFELTAIKASGISLLKTMSPLIILISMVAVGAFFFQNNVLPKAQVKMWTLLFSMRQKSPELEIPEGTFYNQIEGYSVFVKHKDLNTGKLYDLMIYDVTQGFNNSRIILADSGKMSSTRDKRHLYLELWHGEQFENLSSQQVATVGAPYRKESFSLKNIMISFDESFTRMDDSTMRKQYVGKNIAELRQTIDSVNLRLDSIGHDLGVSLQDMRYVGVENFARQRNDKGEIERVPVAPITKKNPISAEIVLKGKTLAERQRVIAYALDRARQMKNEYEFRSYTLSEDKKVIRRHQIEMHKKFTLSIACLVFFFIGAPLGAIIRKGGIGTPIVISVLLFVFYYIIDTTGYKLARDGRLEVWEGIWVSTAVLMPLGIFLTYKAMNDSDVFKSEVYVDLFRRLTGRGALRKVEYKEVVMDDVNPEEAIQTLQQIKSACESQLYQLRKHQHYTEYWHNDSEYPQLRELSVELESCVNYLSNSRSVLVVNKLMDFPIIKVGAPMSLSWRKALKKSCAVFVPIGLVVYYINLRQRKHMVGELKSVAKICDELTQIYTDIINTDDNEQRDN